MEFKSSRKISMFDSFSHEDNCQFYISLKGKLVNAGSLNLMNKDKECLLLKKGKKNKTNDSVILLEDCDQQNKSSSTAKLKKKKPSQKKSTKSSTKPKTRKLKKLESPEVKEIKKEVSSKLKIENIEATLENEIGLINEKNLVKDESVSLLEGHEQCLNVPICNYRESSTEPNTSAYLSGLKHNSSKSKFVEEKQNQCKFKVDETLFSSLKGAIHSEIQFDLKKELNAPEPILNLKSPYSCIICDSNINQFTTFCQFFEEADKECKNEENSKFCHLSCTLPLNLKIGERNSIIYNFKNIKKSITTDRHNFLVNFISKANFKEKQEFLFSQKFSGYCDFCGKNEPSIICDICNKGFHLNCGVEKNCFIKISMNFMKFEEIGNILSNLKSKFGDFCKPEFDYIFRDFLSEAKPKDILFEKIICNSHNLLEYSDESFEKYTNLTFFLNFIQKVDLNFSSFKNLYQAQKLFHFASCVDNIALKMMKKTQEYNYLSDIKLLKIFETEIHKLFDKYLSYHVQSQICPQMNILKTYVHKQSLAQKIIEILDKADSGVPVSFKLMKSYYFKLSVRNRYIDPKLKERLETEIIHVKRISKNKIIKANLSKNLMHYCNYKVFVDKSVSETRHQFLRRLHFFLNEYRNRSKTDFGSNNILNSENLMGITNEGRDFMNETNPFTCEFSQIFFKFTNFKHKIFSGPAYYINLKPREYYEEFKEIGILDKDLIKKFLKAFFVTEIGKYGHLAQIFDKMLIESDYENENFIWDHSTFKRFEFFKETNISNIDIIASSIDRSYNFLKLLHSFLKKINGIKENFENTSIKQLITLFQNFLKTKNEVQNNFYKLSIILKSLIDFALAPNFIRTLYLKLYLEIQNGIEETLIISSLGHHLTSKIKIELEREKCIFPKKKRSKTRVSTTSSGKYRKGVRGDDGEIEFEERGSQLSNIRISDKIDDFISQNIKLLTFSPKKDESIIMNLIHSNFEIKKEIMRTEKKRPKEFIRLTKVFRCFSHLDEEFTFAFENQKEKLPEESFNDFLIQFKKFKSNSKSIQNRIEKMYTILLQVENNLLKRKFSKFHAKLIKIQFNHIFIQMFQNPFCLRGSDYDKLNFIISLSIEKRNEN